MSPLFEKNSPTYMEFHTYLFSQKIKKKFAVFLSGH